MALTERTLALVPRAKYPHCSARARDGLISLPPLHSLTHLLHRFRRSLPLIPKSSKLTRPSMQPTGAPNLQTAKTSSLRSSRGSNLHCVPVLADRARKIFSFRKDNPASTERTLALVPRAKPPHCLARARDGLVSLPPLHSLTHLLHRFRRSLPLISKSSKLTRPSMQTAGAPNLQTAKTSSLRSSRGSNRHCVSGSR